MTSRGSRRCSLLAATAVSLVAIATGCGSSSPDPDPTDSPTTGTSASTSSPTPSATSTIVEPADGRLIKVPGASMHALATYKRVSDYGIVQGYNDGQSSVTFSPSLTRAASLDAFAKEWIKEHGGPKVKVRQDDAVVGGKYSAWHVIDTVHDPYEIQHDFGLMFLDSAWLIDIKIYLDGTPETLSEEEQQQVIDSLLASFKTDLD